MKDMIFLDNASTTRVYDAVYNKMKEYMIDEFFNPSALYTPAFEVSKLLDEKRREILSILNAEDDYDIIFCGSATEANNLALNSGLSSSKTLAVSVGDHPSVYEKAKSLKTSGNDVIFIDIDENGKIDKTKYMELDFSKISMISIIHVSNETGAVNDIKELVSYAKKKNPNILFHSDGVQAFLKINVDLSDLGVDYYTISAHKVHGPKGIGALIYKKKAKIKPLIIGGGQEKGLRSGTENVPYIVAFAEAARIKNLSVDEDYRNLSKLKEDFKNAFKKSGLNITFNSCEKSSPYILSLSIEGLRGEVLTHALEKHNIFIGTGSACSSKKIDNRVLRAMNRSQAQIEGNIRISFSVSEIGLDANKIVKCITNEAQKLLK